MYLLLLNITQKYSNTQQNIFIDLLGSNIKRDLNLNNEIKARGETVNLDC